MRFLKRRTKPLLAPALIAARWWADEMRGGYNRFNLGDESDTGGIVVAMATLHYGRADEPKAGSIDAFELYLARALSDELYRLEAIRKKLDPKQRPNWHPVIFLHVDHGPEGMLLDALRATKTTGLSMSIPTKSSMSITTSEVKVACGYQSDWVELPIPAP